MKDEFIDDDADSFFAVNNKILEIWGKQIKPMGFMIYCCLKLHAYGNNCSLSHKYIADMCGISRASVIRNLKLLAELELITIEQFYDKSSGGRLSNLYIINELPIKYYSEQYIDITEKILH